MSKQLPSNGQTTRRDFLKQLAVTGAAAAAAAAGGVLAAPEPADTPVEPKKGSKGYELTDHIREYYRTASL